MTIKTIAATLALLAPLAAHAQVTSGPAGNQPYCREFTQTVTIGNKTQQGWGTACLQPDGSWQIQPNTVQNDDAATATPQPGVQYVVEDQSVYLVPPEPFVTGSIYIEGRTRHFSDDFRPHRGPWGWDNNRHWQNRDWDGPGNHRH
jgi:hypothetical protein